MGGLVSGSGSIPSKGQQIVMGSLGSSLGQKKESLIKVATPGKK